MTIQPANRPAPVDAYARITSRILEQLEQGVTPWTQPWSADHLAGRVTRPLRVTGEAYQGINVLLLWMEAVAVGHPSPTWMTYQQAQKLGAQVRKGERGTPVVYYGEATRKGGAGGEAATDQGGDSEDGRPLRFLKTYTVFNTAQIDGLPERFAPAEAPSPALPGPERIAHAEAFFAATGLEVRHGGDRAFYSVKEDRIQLPPIEAFRDAESYYATRGHESVHATRHLSRLDRDLGRKRFGDEGYAREELVAELGSAFLAPTSAWRWSPAPTTPPISKAGSRCCRTTIAPSSKRPRTPSGRSGSCTGSSTTGRRRPPRKTEAAGRRPPTPGQGLRRVGERRSLRGRERPNADLPSVLLPLLRSRTRLGLGVHSLAREQVEGPG